MTAELQLWENLTDKEIRKKIRAISYLGKPSTVEALCIKSALEEEFWKCSEALYKKCQKRYEKLDQSLDAVMSSLSSKAPNKDLGRDWRAVAELQEAEMGSPLKAKYIPKLFTGVKVTKKTEKIISGSIKSQTDIRFCAAKLSRAVAELNKHIKQMRKKFNPPLFWKICVDIQCISFLLHMLYDLHEMLHTNQIRFKELDKDLVKKLEAGTKLDAESGRASDKLILTMGWFDRIVAGKVTEKMLERPS